MTYTRLRNLAVALLLTPLLGCSGSDGRGVVTGRLVDNGQPFALDPTKLKLPGKAAAVPPGTRTIQMFFIPAEGGDMLGAAVDETNWTFTVPGPDGKGIKPGKYKIAITGGVGGGAPDYFGGKYTPDKTPIVREVKPGEEVVIDVSKPQG